MSRKIKFYKPGLFHRAGKPLNLFDGVGAYELRKDGSVARIGWASRLAITRDGAGLPKELARLTASIDPARLILFHCGEQDSHIVGAQIENNLRSSAVKEAA